MAVLVPADVQMLGRDKYLERGSCDCEGYGKEGPLSFVSGRVHSSMKLIEVRGRADLRGDQDRMELIRG